MRAKNRNSVYVRTMEAYERTMLTKALQVAGSITACAKMMGKTRSFVQARIRYLEIPNPYSTPMRSAIVRRAKKEEEDVAADAAADPVPPVEVRGEDLPLQPEDLAGAQGEDRRDPGPPDQGV